MLEFDVMSTPEFKFLEDKPLETSKELSTSKFGHEEIAKTLSKIIKSCPAPFTIGLFAKWGAGKSTVANSLKKQLPDENIPVVIFDVWKHEGDALRRTFLKEAVRQLKEYGSNFFNTRFELDDRLEKSVSHSSEARFKFEWGKLKQVSWYGLIGLAILGVIGFLAHLVGQFEIFKQLLIDITGFTTGGAFLIWLVQESVQLFSSETTSYGVDRFEDPHEFEEQFSNVLRELKHPRILIVFDNLDRVTHDKVAEVLSTIKTFLEPRDLADLKKEVIFLVPCDARAIKQHLSNIYGSSDNYVFDPDEFLRKFFNSILWIPDFIPAELESFARSSLQATKVALLNNDYVAWIITKAFRNNPRQIIQFVNILLANYLLVQEREGDGKDFPKDFLKENIPQLTKYLVLNQLFPDEMETLREKKILNLQDVAEDDLKEDKDDKISKTQQAFLDFINETPSIPINNLRIFFTLRRSEQEKKFPGFDSFIALLEDQKLEDSKKYFSQLGDFSKPELVEDFSQAIKTELEAKTNPVSLANLIYSLLSILDENKVVLKDTVYGEINNALKNKCKDQIHVVLPSLINQALLLRDSAYRSAIVDLWIGILENFVAGNLKQVLRERIDQIFEVLSEHPDYLNTEQTRRVTNVLAQNLPNDLNIGKIIIKNTEAQKKLLSKDYVTGFIAAIPDSVNIPEITQRIEVVDAFENSIFDSVAPSVLIEKMTKIQTMENQRAGAKDPEKLSDVFRKVLSKHMVFLKTATEAIRNAFITTIIDSYNSLSPHDAKGILVPMLVELRRFAPTTRVAEIDGIIGAFLTSVTATELKGILEKLPEMDKKEFFDQSFYSQAENRALNDEAFRNEFYRYLSEARRKAFIERLFSHNFTIAIQFIESLGVEENPVIFGVFTKVWSSFDAFAPSDKKKVFALINARQAGEDADVRETFATKITSMLNGTDLTLQEIALEAFVGGKKHLSDPRSRKISKEVFDWLSKPELTNKYQPHAIKAAFSEYKQFNDEEKGLFLQFLFDDLIRKGTNAQQIDLGFELLREIQPSYEDRKQNFDDVRTRAETESVAEIKQALMAGLISLQPTTKTEGDKSFWEEVIALSGV